MSQRRRIARQAGDFDFRKLATCEDGKKHGCELCRGDERRKRLAAEMLKQAKVMTLRATCDDCKAEWRVALFESTPGGELRIGSQPIVKARMN